MIISIPCTKKTIGGDDVFIIAEIGKNFIQTEEERSVEEYLANAKVLVDAAINAGADAVKFQTHEVEDEQLNVKIVSPHFSSVDRYKWVERNTKATPLNEFWRPLKAYCDQKKIIFFSTPMSRCAAQKINGLNMPLWKIGSADIQDRILLNFIAKTKKPTIISTGMVSLAELDETVTYLRSKQLPVIILYCVSHYPAPAEYFNLATIDYLKEQYPDITIGFSDHSLGNEVTLAAVKLGAKVIEKHFSISRDLWGADHKVSMTPFEFKQMVALIRNGKYKNISVDNFYGVKNKELEGKNNKYRSYFNKSLVAGENISAGTTIGENMIYAMRPRNEKGIPSNRLEDVVGRQIKKSMVKYESFTDKNLIL